MRRSTSVSIGSIVQSWYVILEAYVIPFPCREPDLGGFHRLIRVADAPRSLADCLLVAVSWRLRLLFPGLFSVDCLPDCDSASLSARCRFRCFGLTVSGVAMQTSAIVVSMGLLPCCCGLGFCCLPRSLVLPFSLVGQLANFCVCAVSAGA